MALPALAGELIAERTREDVARLLTIRHAGIAIALALLAPIISANLDSTIADAREQGTAALLDARLPPEEKITLAPQMFAGINTDDPRGQLERSIDETQSGLEGEEAAEVEQLGDRLDDVVTGAVRAAFRVAFIVTAGLALAAALVLLWGALAPAVGLRRTAVASAGIAALLVAAGYGVAFGASQRETVKIGDPCEDRELPSTGGIGGALQDLSLAALDRAACDFGSSREELLLALFDDERRQRTSRTSTARIPATSPPWALLSSGSDQVRSCITTVGSQDLTLGFRTVCAWASRCRPGGRSSRRSSRTRRTRPRSASDWLRSGSDEAVLELPYRDELATMGDVVHGGAVSTLIDTAAMAAAWASDEVPENPAGATVALSVNFASAARGVDLRAESKVVRRGGRLSFCEIAVRDPEGELVAHGIATYRFG